MGGKNKWVRIPRDTILLLAGIGLTVNEALFREGPERPYLYILFAGMMGLPFVLGVDEGKKMIGGGRGRAAEDQGPAQQPWEDRKSTPLEFRGLCLV